MKPFRGNPDFEYDMAIRQNNVRRLQTLKRHRIPPCQLALLSAVTHSHVRLIPLLVEAGANPNEKDAYGQTALGYAVQRSASEFVKALLEVGADPNLEAVAGKPLAIAALYGQTGNVRLLLERGADPNGANRTGVTALFWAREQKRTEIIRMLVAAGANKRIRRKSVRDVKLTPSRDSKRKRSTSPLASDTALGGAADFRNFMFRGEPEWSLWAVEAPLETVTAAFATFRRGIVWARDILTVQPKKNGADLVRMVPVIQIKGSSWVVAFRSLYCVFASYLEFVPAETQALSQKLKTRAVSFIREDTSGCNEYELYERGKLVKRVQAGHENDFPDAAFRELGLYIPACMLDEDSRVLFMSVDPASTSVVERVDIVCLNGSTSK